MLESNSDLSANSIAHNIAQILPAGIISEFAAIENVNDNLHKEEMKYICNAVSIRKKEFLAGRACARRALARLGIPNCPILVGPMREPIWPEIVSGSISHDGNYCVAAVALKKTTPLLGIDIALREPLNKELIKLICTKKDIEAINNSDFTSFEADPYKLIFSVKESVYKCLFPVIQKIFDF